MAITLSDLIPDLESWDIQILGSDIDFAALEQAKRGVYSTWSFRGVSDGIRTTCFTAISDDTFELRDRYRSMVTFRQLNIVDDLFPYLETGTSDFDLILCRNVLIYFRPDTIARVSRRLYDSLAEDGWLILGHAEHGSRLDPRFRREIHDNAVAYRKAGGVILPTSIPSTSATRQRKSEASPPRRVPVTSQSPRSSLSRGLKNGTGAVTDSLLVAARKSYEACDYRLSIRHLNDYLAVCPDCQEAILMLSRCEANLGNLEAARYQCERAIRLNPLDVEAHYLLAILSINEGKLDKAVECLRRASYLNARSPALHYQLGNCLRALRRADPARKAFHRAAELLAGMPDDAEVPLAEGMLVGQLKRVVARELGAYSKRGR